LAQPKNALIFDYQRRIKEIRSSTPPHRPHFTSSVGVDGREVASGEGGSIKESEQAAARAALE
jgi:ribonuclease III